MGASGSKPTTPVNSYSEKGEAELVDRLTKYLTLNGSEAAEINPVSSSSVKEWEQELLSDPKNRLALSTFTNGDVRKIVRNREAIVQDQVHVFSDKIDLEGTPITSQNSTGRCWIFASTNVLRTYLQKKYNLESFQFSQAYLFFYDKLEKSNFFFQQIIETANEPLDSRLVQTLFADPASDGGQWDMIVNLIDKYGLVPQTLYPDAWNASNSGAINYLVVHKLREYGLVLREAAAELSHEKVLALKTKFVQEIHGLLTLAFGQAPKPDEKFVWEFYDKNGKYNRVETTPLVLAKELPYSVGERYSLIHDPRNAYKQLYTVDRLGNIAEGKAIEYVNAEISVLKNAAIKAIKNNEPVFFGSDVGKFSDRDDGILDAEIWDFELGFGTSLGLTKADRLRVHESAMTHAMVLTAVNIVDGKPTKWRVENSWGESVGKKGYFIMSDKWFDEYVFQVVTHPKYVDKEYTDIWKSKNYTVLPRWDPLGALA